MSSILLFTDLDETLFQLLRHNEAGRYPATTTPTTRYLSYQTDSQRTLFEFFHQSEQVTLIPVTARGLRQYHNTFLSRLAGVEIAVLYFGGVIWQAGQADAEWGQQVYQAFLALEQPLAELANDIQVFLTAEQPDFLLHNTDGFYLTVQAPRDCDLETRAAVFAEIKQLASSAYLQYLHRRNFVLLPHFIDKRHAVNFLLQRLPPASLTLGMGDSLSDLPFMQLCDVRLVPRHAQIEQCFPPWPPR